jgi:hypothetical protein
MYQLEPGGGWRLHGMCSPPDRSVHVTGCPDRTTSSVMTTTSIRSVRHSGSSPPAATASKRRRCGGGPMRMGIYGVRDPMTHHAARQDAPQGPGDHRHH